MNKSVSTESVIVLWGSTRVRRDVLRSALEAINCGAFMPKQNLYDALVEACKDVVRTMQLDEEDGSIKYEALKGGKSRCEVIRKVKGNTKNDWEHLFSAGLMSDGQDFKVELLSSVHPDVVSNTAGVEAALHECWEEKLKTVPASDVTETITTMIRKKCFATALKKGGGVYVMMKQYVSLYEQLAAALSPDGVTCCVTHSELDVNPEMAAIVVDQITTEIANGLEAMRNKAGGKTAKRRKNGDKTRFDQLRDYMETIKAYKPVLANLPVDALSDAIDETKKELGLEAFKSGVGM